MRLNSQGNQNSRIGWVRIPVFVGCVKRTNSIL